MKRTIAAAAALAAFTAASAFAQESEAPTPQKPADCTGAPYTDFDFWAGEWDVYTQDGQQAGTNSITREEGGCLLVEHWTSAQGGTGQSYNFYDPAMKKWRQVWVARGAVIDYAGALNADGDMALEGEITYRKSGKSFPFRGVWSRQDDGAVKQHFTQYNPETENWDEWFTGIYRPKAD